MTRKNKKELNEPRSSIRLKIFLAFALLIGVVMLVLWLTQVAFLGVIYKNLKLNELYTCSDMVYSTLKADEDLSDAEELVGEYAKKYNICISVFEIKNSRVGRVAVELVTGHVNTFCFVHNVRAERKLNEIYNNTLEADGEYIEEIDISKFLGRPDEETRANENVILSNIIENGDRELLILFDSELLPLASTVNTVRVQLLFISVIMLIVAAILAAAMSDKLSRSIRDMSKEAGKLALGDYNVNFDGGNCTETVMLSETLNRAAYELSRLDKMQKDLIANVSHDLRTPLTMIAGYTEAMRDLPGEATPENMQIVIDETKRLTNLVSDMLEVSRYQGGTQQLRLTRFSLTESVRKTIGRYSKLLEHDGYKITFEADRDVFVNADEGRILQVLYNLVSNAVNYTGEDKTVLIRQSMRGEGGVVIEVIDSGRGIPEEELPLVWERYYKVNDFHKRANMGTGLGLSIVKNILLLHEAEFGVNSTVGKGSCFWFILKTDEIGNDSAQIAEA